MKQTREEGWKEEPGPPTRKQALEERAVVGLWRARRVVVVVVAQERLLKGWQAGDFLTELKVRAGLELLAERLS